MRGLVAQKKTGHFGRTWWGKQVERALEEPYRGQDGVVRHPHVARAKALARNGAILAMEHHGTTVAGEVQGSQLDPFAPTISGTPASTDTIIEVRAAIARHPGSAEQIIAGSLPTFLEDLLPLHAHDLRCACTCPVSTGHCSHTLALGYLLVERMDRDSEWYLQLRGISLADVLVSADPLDEAAASDSTDEPDTSTTALRERRDTESGSASVRGQVPQGAAAHLITRPTLEPAQAQAPDSPIALDPQRYWALSGELPDLPHPLPNPAYHDLDPVQWMAAASTYTSDPVNKLTLESDLHDAWDYLVERDVSPTVTKEYSDE